MMWDSARGPIAAVFCVFLISQSSCDYPDLSGGMTGNNSFTLCCTKTGGLFGIPGLFSVYWYRNDTLVFKTYRLYGTNIVDSSFQNSVKLRLTWRRHCVDVSKVEAGISEWRCNNDNDKSTWSESIHLSGFTAGETPFELSTDTPVRDDISESDTFLMPSAPTSDENVTNVQTTVSMAVLSTENTRTPKPSQDSTLFIVTGVLLTALMLLIVTISTVIVCRKNTQGPRSASATAETVPQEQEAGLCINPVYVASHAMEGPLGSTALADSRARLEGDGNRHPDGRGDYDVPEMNVPQPSNYYEQLKVYKEI